MHGVIEEYYWIRTRLRSAATGADGVGLRRVPWFASFGPRRRSPPRFSAKVLACEMTRWTVSWKDRNVALRADRGVDMMIAITT